MGVYSRQNGKSVMALVEDCIRVIEEVIGRELFDYEKDLVRIYIYRSYHDQD